MKPTLLLLAMLPATLACAAGEIDWKNPVVKDRADPQVFLHTDGYYYMTASVPEYDRVEIRRAKTLGGLTTGEKKVIWRKHSSGPMSQHIWAPELHFIDGKWYVYFAASEAKDIWKIRLWALENDSKDPFQGKWVEKGQFNTGWESFALDATTFMHKGTRYFVWAQAEPGKGPSNIYIAKMKSPLELDGPGVCIARAELPWELRQYTVQEGPAVLIRNGKVFMTYSTNSTDHKYCMGMLTADENADLLNPASWKKSPEPVLDSDPANKTWGPGHNSFTTTKDGKTDLLVYHARDYKYDGNDPLHTGDRATRVKVVGWKPDGTPDFTAPDSK